MLGDDLPKPTFAGRSFTSEKNQVDPSGWVYAYKVTCTLAPDYRSIEHVRIDGLQDNSLWSKKWSIELRDLPINSYSLNWYQLNYSTRYREYLLQSQFIRCEYTFTSKASYLKSYSATAFDVSRSTASVSLLTRR
jgi:hypothetical protein